MFLWDAKLAMLQSTDVLQTQTQMIKPTDITKRFYLFFAKPRAHYVLTEILASRSDYKPPHILPIGANDEILYGPIHNTLLRRPNITATRIGRLTEHFNEPRSNCASFASRVELFNVCIGEEDGLIDFFV